MKVGIVGAGFVGAAAGYAMVLRNSCRELVLIDANKAKAEAEANDLQHATPVSHPVLVSAGEYADLKGAKVVVVTAGVNQRPGESRLDLIGRNVGVFRQVIPRIIAAEPDAVILIATNPVDLLTTVTEQIGGLRPGQVIGSGTTLDTARFRALVADHVGVDAHHVHGYVLGEHGDSEVVAWSSATVAGMRIAEYCQSLNIPWDTAIRDTITENVRTAAYSIIKGKGATYYGIGAVLANITERIIRDQRAILTVSGTHERYGVALSLPRVVGGKGIIAEVGVALSEDELRALQASADVLSTALRSIPHAP
ncbi:MAG: L-lactate dehydrogenase [Bacteroidetes bacterium]|nr:L-lactate dehydrogenase [Bacteroidota bacterium]